MTTIGKITIAGYIAQLSPYLEYGDTAIVHIINITVSPIGINLKNDSNLFI